MCLSTFERTYEVYGREEILRLVRRIAEQIALRATGKK